MTYEYQCPNCGNKVEVKEKGKHICDQCGAVTVRKWNAPLVVYKGNGWTGAQKDER